MRPFVEATEDGEYNDSGFWDWYQIGGHWTGFLSAGDYDPTKDRRNMERCWLCGGSGRREWQGELADFCNACDSTGIAIKHASQWVTYPGDVVKRSHVTDETRPYTLVTGGRAFHKSTWNGEDFDDTSGELDAAFASLSPEATLVVVDYHS